MKKISIIAPVYNEQDTISELYTRLIDALQKDFSDFTIETLSYYNFFLFPLAFFARKSNQSFVSQMEVRSQLKNNFLRSVFSFEKYFLPWISFPVGVSLVAICRK